MHYIDHPCGDAIKNTIKHINDTEQMVNNYEALNVFIIPVSKSSV